MAILAFSYNSIYTYLPCPANVDRCISEVCQSTSPFALLPIAKLQQLHA